MLYIHSRHRVLLAIVSALLLAAGVLLLTARLAAADSANTLLEAVKRGDRAAVRKLIAQKPNVNAPEPDGTTPLHWAVRSGDREMTGILLRAGARATTPNRYGVTPLRLAAINGSAPLIDALLEAGASPDSTNAEGETTLMTAARAGSVDAVRLLAKRGANVNAREDWFGETALMWAAAENHADVVRTLVSLGADLNARSADKEPPVLEFPQSGGPNMPFPRGGWTALMYAAREGAIDSARALVELGADMNVTALPQTDVALTPQIRQNAGKVGTTAMVYAIINAHFDLAAMLAEKGADPNIEDTSGMAALYAAVEWNTLQWVQSRPAPIFRDRLDGAGLVKVLLAHGANPNATLKAAPIKISLDPGATLNFGRGTTPLMRAARTNDVDSMRHLIDGGADVNAALPDGTTVLMIAAGQGLQGPRGDGPRIRVPTEAGAVEAVRLLVDKGAKVNATSTQGATALHAAVNRGDGVVRLLVERGADLTAKNKFGQTPLDAAAGGGGGRRGGGPPSPAREKTAALLRQLMTERGIPIPPPAATPAPVTLPRPAAGQ
jgi:ankyrin repeat protein